MGLFPSTTPTPTPLVSNHPPTPTATSSSSSTPTATPSGGLADYRGIYALEASNIIPAESDAIFSSPVDGIVLRLTWNFLEPHVGQRDFSKLSTFLATCATHNKKAGLYIAALATYPSDLDPATVTIGGAHPYQLAYPWGETFLEAFKDFVAALGQFDGQLQVLVMGGFGVNGASILADDPAVISALNTVGGMDAWQGSCHAIADAYMAAFHQSRCMFSAKNPYGEGNDEGASFLNAIVRSLCAQYPHRIGVSNVDLFEGTNAASLPNRLIHDLGPTNPTGYQLRDNATHPFGPGLCLKGSTPSPTNCLAESFAAGIRNGAREEEVYVVDANNPAFANLIRTTSAQLKALDP